MTRRFNQFVILGLLLLFTFSELYLIRDTLGCAVGSLLPVWITLICLSTWFTTCSRRGLWIGLPLSALLLFAAYEYYRADLLLQISDLFDRITGVYMEQIAYPGETYSYANSVFDHNLLFVLLAFLFSSYMSSAITSRAGRLGLTLIGGLPFTLACLAANRHPPILAVVGLVLFFLLLAAGGSHYAEESNAYRAVVSSLLPLALLLAALVLIVRPSQYHYDPAKVRLNQELQRLADSFDAWISERVSDIVLPHADRTADREETQSPELLPGQSENEAHSALWESEIGGLDLTRGFDEADLARVYMTLRASDSGTLYLRAVSYGDYIGTGWLPAESYSGSSSLPFAALALDAAGIGQRALSVRLLQDSSYRYLPYFSTETSGSDSYVPASQNAYSLRYFDFPESFDPLSVPSQLSAEEAAYSQYAHETYTQLPAATRDTLLSLAQQAGLSADASSLIEDVARYVQANAVYDLHTEAYPSADYALYFLTDAHRGYCIHYATAAAALYRALGVPARVVEGFLVAAEAGRVLEVTGENAHAWVEIYRDGLGWLPVEVTGRSGLSSDALGAGEPEPTPQTLEPSTEPIGPEASSPSQTQPLEPEPTEAADRPVGLLTQTLQEELSEQAGLSAKKPSRWIFVVLALLLPVTLLPLWHTARRLLRLRSFEQSDSKKAAVAIYQTALSASAFGESVPDEIRRCAERAVFSAHAVTAEELEGCRDALYRMLKSQYLRLNPWKKFQFKYLYGFL